MIATAGAILLGLLVGARHALEPDHLAAVSTLVTGARSPRGAALLGLVWGLGHTIALLAVGVALVVLDAGLPARAGAAFELGVAAMLVVLGARAVVLGLRNANGRAELHRHGELVHAHGGAGAHVHLGTRAIAWRPLTVGLVHGLAGSGALAALAFAELPSSAARVGYMVVFGLGSIAGMAIATGLAGAALHRLASGPRASRALAIATGFISCATGIVWAV